VKLLPQLKIKNTWKFITQNLATACAKLIIAAA